jgi:DNA polymerase-1
VKGKTKVIFSDPAGNFRYELEPQYKANRKDLKKSPEFYALREWALKKYIYESNLEADDLCGYYARKGYIVCSIDKDVIKGVAGTFFDVYHARRTFHDTSELEARNFTLLQTLMGDTTDNIKGIKGVGEATAIKLLDKHGWSWDGVVKAYEEKGLTEDDAVLTRRLVGMDQWHKKKGLKLWQPKKTK